MPANLTPQYKEAEERYKAAETPADKLAALEEMLAVIPKHKGTEKIQADIKRRISTLKKEASKRSEHGKRGIEYNVEKEGGGQVVLVGPPNSGKSSLLARLTNAQPEIADYPYTTLKPLPGMMEYEGVKVQIVDLPPISDEFTEPWMTALIRNADAAAFVIDASSDSVLDSIESTLDVLEKFKVHLYGWGKEVPNLGSTSDVYKKAIMVATKMDDPSSFVNFDDIKDFYGNEFPILMVSARNGRGIEDLRAALYKMLDIVRVYTKTPGKPPDMGSPFVLPRGSTVEDLAAAVHKDFASKLRYAKLWNQSGVVGKTVGRDYAIQDLDIIELHI